MIIILVWMFLALFGSSQSTWFQCQYYFVEWESIYYCNVENSVNITSSDAAQVNSISGKHQAGYNNDNVDAISLYQKGQINYFPRGLNKIFKNLKEIAIASTGLKEIHQSDLKDFPKLLNLYLYSSNLEALEENLFEFNPNLEVIYLGDNQISHIDPNVFDKLAKLKTLCLELNTCIDMCAWNNSTKVQDVIKTIKSQCISSDFSDLDQKVKNLQIESKNSSSDDFKEKLEILENEIKNSEFQNTFYQRIQDLKADLIEKDLVIQTSNHTDNCKAELTALNDILAVLKMTILEIDEKITQISNTVISINENNNYFDNIFSKIFKAFELVFSRDYYET